MSDTQWIAKAETKKIGEVLWWKGRRIVVVEGFACDDCAFFEGGCQRPYGYGVCTSVLREDNKNVHFEWKKSASDGNRKDLFGKSRKDRKTKLRRTHTRG